MPIDSKPVVFISGNWCWRQTAGGRVGMLRCLVWVLDMCDPLGNNTFTGVTTGTFFFYIVSIIVTGAACVCN